MKKYSLLFFLVPFLTANLFSQRKAEAIFIGSFYYGVQLNCSNISVAAAGKKWTNDIYENKGLFVMLESIKRALLNGKLKGRNDVFDRSDTASFEINQVASKFFIDRSYETDNFESIGGTLVVLREEIFFDRNIYLGFYEDWYYNAEANELTKEVRGIGLGKYNEDKEAAILLVAVPLTNSDKFHADLNLNDISYESRSGNWGDPEVDAYFHVLTNKLVKKANSDHALLRSTNYPFAEKIPESLFKITCDTISKCYDFGFSEDWAYDSVNFSLRKTVKNIHFSYKKGADFPLRPKATFVFNNFKENLLIKNSLALDCIETDQPYYTYLNDALKPEDSLVKNGITKLVKTLNAKIIVGELSPFMPAECAEMGKVRLTMDEYKNKLTIERPGVEYDSMGNFITERTYTDTISYFDGLVMNESVRFDLAANKVRCDVKMITPLFFIDYKEIYKSLFSVPVKTDSNYIPVPADLVCKNARQKIVFQKDNLLFEGNVGDMNYQGFDPRNNYISYKERFELLSSVYSLAQNGAIKLYKPGTDSVLSTKEISVIKDSLTIKSLGQTETPNWFLSVSQMQTLEDWYYNEKTNVFKIVTKEIIFCRERATGLPEKVFSLKFAQ